MATLAAGVIEEAGTREPLHAATLDEIGAELGVTRERARQLEADALAKFRCALALWDELGADRALAIMGELRGRNVKAYKARLRAVRRAHGRHAA